MNKLIVCVALLFCYSLSPAQSSLFIENKGQIVDQNGNQRNDIRFSLQSGSNVLFITNNGFSIQNNRQIDSLTIQSDRIDYSISNFKPTKFSGVENNYFETYVGSFGQYIANSFTQITATDEQTGLSIHYYINETGFKYDIILPENYPLSSVDVKIGGADLSVEKEQVSINYGAATLYENMPEVYSKQGSRKIDKSAYYEEIEGGYRISFEQYSGQLVIDPEIIFSTYYGGSFSEHGNGVAVDQYDNIFLFGTTSSNSNIATQGAYQYTYVNTGNMFLAKFNDEGQRQWGTYFNSSYPNPRKVEIDAFGNIYLAGITGSGDNLGTPGVHQTVFGGDYNDAFLAKFNDQGFPIWSTLFGGEGNDILNGLALAGDAVYLTGYTASHTQIATPGSFQDTTTTSGYNNAGYIAKFDTTGNLEVATYVGGYNDNKLNDIKYYDSAVYVVGTFNTWDKGTPGAYLSSKTSNSDLFFSKFDENLDQVWGSYFTGNSHVEGYHKIAVQNDRIYIAGYVYSSAGNTSYATLGAHKDTADGGAEVYIQVFDTSGTTWIKGTYFGGIDGDYPIDIETITDSTFAITGQTNSIDQIATNDVHKDYFTYAAGPWSVYYDIFVAVFNDSLEQIWGTYYGGEGEDFPLDLAVNSKKQLLVAGRTTSQTGIAFGIAHQQFNGGVGAQPDAILAVFDSDRDSLFTDKFVTIPGQICPKEYVTIPFEIQGTYYPDNVFELWLSDEFGDFTNATLVSTAAGQNSGSFNYQMPYLIDGGNYKFRVDATSPAVSGLSSGSVSILQSPIANFNYQVGINDVYFTDATMNASSWNWSFDDGSSSIQQDPMHIFALPGMYNVSLAAANATCSDTAFHQVLIEEVLGVDQKEGFELKVFPNPSSENLNVYSANFNGTAEITTLDGKFIDRKTLSQNQNISVELEKGVYLISFVNSRGEVIKIEKVIQL